MKKIKLISLMILSAIIITSCATSGVDRLDENYNEDLSGYWNDTDIRIVSESLVNECLSAPWILDYLMNSGNMKPTVIVGQIQNRSSEHMDTTIISKKFEMALVNSGKVNTVADFYFRDDVREEKLDQQYNASSETAAQLGEETGADFMLQGSVKFNLDQVSNTAIRTYYVDMELINIETGQKVWLGQDTVKKKVQKSSYRF
ncbi:MAG: penicillin-binding protein activator LpoB [Spirochaetia bacterium]|nr:penicillin-binding protein activator LpoB [Spirochaetia bacterium]